MPLLLASNKVRVSCIEAHNDVEAHATWPSSGYAPDICTSNTKKQADLSVRGAQNNFIGFVTHRSK